MLLKKIISEKLTKESEKERECDACRAILDRYTFEDFIDLFGLSEKERQHLYTATDRDYKICIGYPFLTVAVVLANRDRAYIRVMPEIHDLCILYNVYYECN